jgi:carboxymethylenebutenolidase
MMNASSVQTVTNDGAFDVHIVTPPAVTKRPALIICSEAFGVNSHMRDVAERYSRHGYCVFVPDLLWRIQRGIELPYNEAGLKRASEIADEFDKLKGADDVAELVDVIRDRPDCTGKIGIIGFCVGGTVAYLAAARSGLDACVSYYGKGIDDHLDEAAKFICPAVLHYGGADRFIPPTAVAKVRSGLAGNKNVEIYDYPGVDHGFSSEDRRAYNKDVASLAMERTLAVLGRGLMPD